MSPGNSEHSRAVHVTLTTAGSPGAVALIQVHGPGAGDMLRELCGGVTFSDSNAKLVRIADVDEGLAIRWREDWAQLQPHGGPRVVQCILEKLLELGAAQQNTTGARELYPEANTELEADMLAAIAQATSPAAIDLLLAQPVLWQEAISRGWSDERNWSAIERDTLRLHHLMHAPTVVVLGQPNVGKSTLTNRVLGRSASIVADQPGTTRDWVAGLAEHRGVTVRWLDTPGIRASGDPIEQYAITLARQVIAESQVIVALREPEIDWPDFSALPRQPDLFVMNKADRLVDHDVRVSGDGARAHDPLHVSASSGAGVDALLDRVLSHVLGDKDWTQAKLWAFSAKLREIVRRRDERALRVYG